MKLFGQKTLAALLAIGLVLATGLTMSMPVRAQTITVTHWGVSFYGAPYAVAMAKGFFKRHGVSVTNVLTSRGGGTTVRNMLASKLPFGEVALSAAVQASEHGVPIRILGGGVDSIAEIVWVAKKGSPLRSFKSIAHHTIGYTEPGSVTNMLILMAMKAHHIDPATVKLVPAGGLGANINAVLNGALDAGIVTKQLLAVHEHDLQPVFWAKDVLPPQMMQTVTITTASYAKTHRKELEGLLAGRADGVAYIYAHPDEAAEIVAKAYSNSHVALYRKVFHYLVENHYWSAGRLDYRGMDRMVEGLNIVGELKGKPDWAKIVDLSFLPAGQRKPK